MKVWLSNQLNAHKARSLASAWRGKPLTKIEPSKIRNVLLIELGGLGDAVNVFPVLDDLRASFPNAQFSVVCRDYATDLFKLRGGRQGGELRATENLAHVVGIPKSSSGIEKALSVLETTEWDIVVSTCWSTWTTVLALKLRARALTGFWRPWHAENFGFAPQPLSAATRDDHLLLLRYKAVAPLGIEIPSPLPIPQIAPANSDWENVTKKHAWLGAGFIAFVPFCQDGAKSLAVDEAISTLRSLRRISERVVLLGGLAEESALEHLGATIQQVEKWDISPQVGKGEDAKLPSFILTDFDIPQLSAVLHHSRCVVSVDTGTMHLASAVGVPTMGIFKATDPQKCGPRGERVLTIKASELGQPQWQQTVRGWLK